jgi:acetyltransferase-like isoleucine patch superfamily enzyme
MTIKKIYYTFLQMVFSIIEKVNLKFYKKHYPLFLKKRGVKIPLDFYTKMGDGYIHPTCHFDGKDYSLISIGANTTISKHVEILTHDYSISKAMLAMGEQEKGGFFLKNISIGENCFIGANVILLPGTIIENNVIIGAGSVVKGKIPENSIVIGNPAKIVDQVSEFYRRHVNRQDFIKYDYKSGQGEIKAK